MSISAVIDSSKLAWSCRSVARGHSNAEIATELFVSHATVKTHVSRRLMKLGARDSAQLVMIAYESGVVAPGAS